MIDIKLQKKIRPAIKFEYVVTPAIIKAVETAMQLDKPLFITGEPGTGKTKLAKKIAEDLCAQTKNSEAAESGAEVAIKTPEIEQNNKQKDAENKGPDPTDVKPDEVRFDEVPLECNIKSISEAQDLFYNYDAIGHFRAGGQADNIWDFISFNAFGRAILLTHSYESIKTLYPVLINKGKITEYHDGPISSVLLIDEIDKAPRDFPNDLLNEIERQEFRIKELDLTISKAPKTENRIIVVMTSNYEKDMPDAFMRRCIYHYIDFPERDDLKKIIVANTGLDANNKAISFILDNFKLIREQKLRKKPSAPELIDCINMLNEENLLSDSTTIEELKKSFLDKFPVILKYNEDVAVATASVKSN